MADLQIQDQFIALLETNLGIILKIAKAYAHTRQDQEDLINDMVYEMWKAYPNFKGRSKISTWMYRIALNTAMNFNRKKGKKRDILRDALDLKHAFEDQETASDPRIELLYDCIAELDEFNRALILLYLDGYMHEEIAEITGISKTNVGTRISRIKEQLKTSAIAKTGNYGT